MKQFVVGQTIYIYQKVETGGFKIKPGIVCESELREKNIYGRGLVKATYYSIDIGDKRNLSSKELEERFPGYQIFGTPEELKAFMLSQVEKVINSGIEKANLELKKIKKKYPRNSKSVDPEPEQKDKVEVDDVGDDDFQKATGESSDESSDEEDGDDGEAEDSLDESDDRTEDDEEEPEIPKRSKRDLREREIIDDFEESSGSTLTGYIGDKGDKVIQVEAPRKGESMAQLYERIQKSVDKVDSPDPRQIQEVRKSIAESKIARSQIKVLQDSYTGRPIDAVKEMKTINITKSIDLQNGSSFEGATISPMGSGPARNKIK